jgi:hypothetical protein
MKLDRLFIALTVANLGTILFSISAHAGRLAFDAAGNLFVGDLESYSIFKYRPDGTKSTFAPVLRTPVCLTFDGGGNLFVADTGSHSIFKFTPDRVKSTFASGLKPLNRSLIIVTIVGLAAMLIPVRRLEANRIYTDFICP